MNSDSGAPERSNFIREIVADDVKKGTYDGRVVTRFPPEPNGYPHIGHAQSIWLNFGLARDFGGTCHLRFDDTNPTTEDMEYVRAMHRDVAWLGFDWGDNLFHASDYFEQFYAFAVQLIEKGLAYVDSQTEEEIRKNRGTVTEPGTPSPYRDRSVAENLDLFARMRAGEFPDGAHVLRARIDMAAPNMKLRDPLFYRIRHAHHYRTGDAWPIYPMYDFAHPLSDAIEGITHSVCTLEFVPNRAIYDWLLEHTFTEPRPHQYEFARLNLDYTITSKRKLLQLVQEGHVAGWDDPRMPTIAGMRRRGITPEAIRDFAGRAGVTKVDGRVDIALLEHAIRDNLNTRAPRVMAVQRPLLVTLTNWGVGEVEMLDAALWPHDIPREGTRPLAFTRTLYIERDDFAERPPKGFFRLVPGGEVRLRHAYIIRCDEVVKDDAGNVVELRCSVDRDAQRGTAGSDRRIKGTIHWVSAEHGEPAEFRLYDRLFTVPNPEEVPEGGSFLDFVNPQSLEVVHGYVEPGLSGEPETRYQFERLGYFAPDLESRHAAPVFNRIVTLRDTWAKMVEKSAPARAVPQPSKKGKTTAPVPPRDPAAGLDEAQQARFAHLTETHALTGEVAAALAADADLMAFFEQAVAAHDAPQSIANWLVNDLPAVLEGRDVATTRLQARAFGQTVALVDAGTINSRGAREVLNLLAAEGGEPAAIVEARGLRQVSDEGVLAPVIDRIIAANPDKAEAYRGGKTGLMGFFVGQVMRETGGAANPALVQQMVEQKLA